MSHQELRRVVLDLGLEDSIPLWEIAQTCQQEELVTDDEAGLSVLAQCLVSLLRSDEIRVLSGPWDQDENFVLGDLAERLLLDTRQYSAESEQAASLDRVYYVNVLNIAG